MASSTTSRSWTCSCPRPAPSTSWTRPTWTSPASTPCSFFVLQAKSNTQFRRLYSHPADRSSGVICDQTIVLTGVTTATSYPDKLRRIKFHDGERGKTPGFLTNKFTLPALTIAELYRSRLQVELFFK